jgi:phospholipid N-methyltransferase
MEQRVGLLEDWLARIPRGRPVIQITYGPLSPVIKMPDRYVVSHYDFIVRNIHPHSCGLIDEQSDGAPRAQDGGQFAKSY